MKLKRTFLVAASAALLISSVNADEFSLFGGMQSTKDAFKNNKSTQASNFELAYKLIPNKDGFITNTKLKYQNDDSLKYYDLEFLFGYQFGDVDSYGAFRILPLGFGYRYMKFDKFIGVTNDIFYRFDSTGSLYYKGGVEYQKDKFLIDELSLNIGAFYQKATYTGTWSNDNGYHNLGTGTSKELTYKPKGFELEVGLDYNFTDNFALGVKAGYSKISDTFFVDGRKAYISDGFNAGLGLKYKF
ncbi:MAG: hypothetical protein ACTTJC_07885 [Campylobacter sp.]